ncbi:MAG: archease [Nanoarchaeota archaeon]
MPYKFLENVSIADVAFEATGESLEEMFASAGLAVAATQIKDLKSIKDKTKKIIKVKADKIEELLFKFLEELVFLKDKDLLIFSQFKDMKIEKGKYFSCEAHGEKLDPKRHEQLVDVKAVTYHLFEVKKTREGWKARVVLDI